MTEFWLCCEDLNRNIEDQHVAFGPFMTQREAHAFGWGLSYAETEGMNYPSYEVKEDAGKRLRIFINPQDCPEYISPRAWDDKTAWPADEPYDEHEDSAWQCGKDLADDRI